MKRVIIVHGWDGFPEECWFPWLKKELEARGVEVLVPQLPDPSRPKISAWVSALSDLVSGVDRNTFFVAHSTGCAAVLHFLETLPPDSVVGGLVLVGPWLTKLKTLDQEEPENRAIAQSWLSTPIQWQIIRNTTKNIVGIFSDNDQYVDLSDAETMKKKLDASIIVEHDRGHMGSDVGFFELPSALEAILSLLVKD